MSAGVKIGDILRVQFPAQRPPGHEQVGIRPVVIVGIPDQVDQPRFPQLIIVPLTTNGGEYAQNSKLYPPLLAGTGGLTSDSVALVDHVRAVDVSRILGRYGSLTETEYQPIGSALSQMFGF